MSLPNSLSFLSVVAVAIAVGGCAPASMVTRVDPEFAGSNCSGGGVVIYEGADTDGDGALDDVEIERSTFLCAGDVPQDYDGLHLGHAVVRTQADIDALAGVDTITGDLIILGVQLEAVSISGIAHIGGRVFVGNTHAGSNFVTVDLPDLRYVGQGVTLSLNPSLLAFRAPQLQSDSALLTVQLLDNPQLSSLGGLAGLTSLKRFDIQGDNGRFPASELALEHADTFVLSGSIDGAISFPALKDVALSMMIAPDGNVSASFPALVSVGGLEVGGGLQALSMPVLGEVAGTWVMVDAGELEQLSMPQLHTVQGDIEILYADSLLALDLPALTHVGGYFKLQRNGFETIELPALTTIVGAAWVGKNSRLVSANIGSLSSVGDWHKLPFAFELNEVLTTVTRTAGPLAVDGWFVVKKNPVLTDISAFVGLSNVTGKITICDNPMVSDQEVTDLIDALSGNIGGEVAVSAVCP